MRSFSLLEIVTQKDCLSCFIWVLKVLLRLTLIQKGGLYSLRLHPLMTGNVLCLYALGIATGNSCLDGVSLKDCKIIWKTKMRKMKTKSYLETLIVLWIKWRGIEKIKIFINVISIIPCQNSSWIMDCRIYGEGMIQIPLSLPVTIDILVHDLQNTGSILI